MAVLGPAGRTSRRLRRVGAVSGTTLVGLALAAAPAVAADGTIDLQTDEVEVHLVADQGPLTVVEYGDDFTIELPSVVTSAGAEAEVPLADGSSVPAAVVGRSGSTLTVRLPSEADLDGLMSPVGPELLVRGLDLSSAASDAGLVGPDAYEVVDGLDPVQLEIDLDMTSDPTAPNGVPVLLKGSRPTMAVSAHPGDDLTVLLPGDGVYAFLGITELTEESISLARDGTGDPIEAEVRVADGGSSATMTVPADAAPGDDFMTVTAANADGTASILTWIDLTVEEAPAPEEPAPTTAPQEPTTAVNPGLRSNTGVEAAPTTGWVLGGLVPLLLGGALAGRALRRPGPVASRD